MKEIYEKGTKIMGLRNISYSGYCSYSDVPFYGEILFYDVCNDMYQIQIYGQKLPGWVSDSNITLFIQEIYDEALRLYKEAIDYYDIFVKNIRNIRDLLSYVEKEQRKGDV